MKTRPTNPMKTGELVENGIKNLLAPQDQKEFEQQLRAFAADFSKLKTHVREVSQDLLRLITSLPGGLTKGNKRYVFARCNKDHGVPLTTLSRLVACACHELLPELVIDGSRAAELASLLPLDDQKRLWKEGVPVLTFADKPAKLLKGGELTATTALRVIDWKHGVIRSVDAQRKLFRVAQPKEGKAPFILLKSRAERYVALSESYTIADLIYLGSKLRELCAKDSRRSDPEMRQRINAQLNQERAND